MIFLYRLNHSTAPLRLTRKINYSWFKVRIFFWIFWRELLCVGFSTDVEGFCFASIDFWNIICCITSYLSLGTGAWFSHCEWFAGLNSAKSFSWACEQNSHMESVWGYSDSFHRHSGIIYSVSHAYGVGWIGEESWAYFYDLTLNSKFWFVIVVAAKHFYILNMRPLLFWLEAAAAASGAS